MRLLVQSISVVALATAVALALPAFGGDGELSWSTDRAPIVEDASVSSLHLRGVSDGGGGAVMAWQHGPRGGIRAQALDSDGRRDWSPSSGVVVSPTGFNPVVARALSGGVVIAWDERESGKTGIYVQNLDSDGSARWAPGGVKIGSRGAQPTLHVDATGRSWVAWRDAKSHVGRLALVNAEGVLFDPGLDGSDMGGEMPALGDIRLVTDGGVGVIAVWTDGAASPVLRTQRFPLGADWETSSRIVSPEPIAAHTDFDAASDGAGGVIVSWTTGDTDRRVRVQRIDDEGEAVWSPNGVLVADSGFVGGGAGSWASGVATRVLADRAGGAFVAWTDWRDSVSGNVHDNVYLQRIDPAGRIRWSRAGVCVSDDTLDRQTAPEVVADGAGGIIVAYERVVIGSFGNPNDHEIAAARFDGDGNRRWDRLVYADSSKNSPFDQIAPEIVFERTGADPATAIVAWHDAEHGDLYARGIEITAPVNDACANALDVVDGDYDGTLSVATLDGGSTCGGEITDVWYRFTTTDAGTLRVDTCGTNDIGGTDSGVDTVLSLHSDCPGPSGNNELSCNDDWPASADGLACDGIDIGSYPVDSYVELSMSRNQSVLIRVSRYVDSFDGPFTLRARFTPSHGSNDDCADATVVSIGSFIGSLVNATIDGEATCNDPPAAEVWYRYEPASSGTLHVDTCGSNDLPGLDDGVDTVISVHSGCPLGGQTFELPNACNDDWALGNTPTVCEGIDAGDDLDSGLAVPVTAGSSYVIRVSHYPGSIEGDFLLNVSQISSPAGRVPDGGAIPGSPLLLSKLAGGMMRLSWGASCMATDTDFAIYQGNLRDFVTHQSIACSTGGATLLDEPLPVGDHYFLVVPHNGSNEGGYGYSREAAGGLVDRQPAAVSCQSQVVGTCP
jgi:hypothetical protein